MNESARDAGGTDAILKELERENAALRQDRANLERLVAERNELLHLTSFALNQVREATYLLNEAGRLVYVNEEACRTLGYSNTELLQMGVADIDPDWTADRWGEAWPALREKGSVVVETTHRRKDGSLLPVQVNSSHFEYGGKEYNLAIARDVAERERAKLALRESEQRYRQVFDNVSDVLYLLEVTSEGRFRTLEINPAGEQSFGILREKLIGKFVDETMPKEVAEALGEKYRQCVQSGAARNNELTLELPGGLHHYHLTLIPVHDESGRIHRIVGIARDMTAHHRTESLLATQLELEAQFRRLAESTLDVICRYDRQCRLVYANSGLAATLRKPLQDLLGKTPADHESDGRYAQYQGLLEGVIETGMERHVEITVPDGGSGARHHHIRIIAERGLQGEIVGALALGLDITERKEAEQRLYASEQAFRAVVEHSPDYIARYDLDYHRVYANPALLELMSLPASEVLGTTPAELSSFVDAAHYMDRLRRVVETGNEVTEEVRLRDGEGRIRWGHMRIVPEFAPDGKVASVLAVCRDIDELKRSEQLFRTLTENFPDFIARFDRDGRYLYLNPAVTKAYGLPHEALIGKRPSELPTNDADQTERIEQGIQRAFLEGQSNESETRWRTLQGVRILEARHVPEKDAEGRVVSVLGIGRDITRLRTTEVALRDSERAFRTLAENAPDAIVRYDRHCHRTYVNPEFVRVTGVEAEKLLGAPTEVMGATDEVTQRVQATLKEIMESGAAAKFEVNWTRHGEPQCWYAHAVPEYNAEGVVQSVLTIWRDITERKEAEQRLRQSYELLRELTSRRETAREEERKRIAREMHDELGQHLTALRMGVSTLRLRFGRDNPDLGEHVQKILLLSDKTMQVLRDVVTSLRPAVLDAGIAAALEWLAAEFSQHGQATCRLSVPVESPELAEERAVAIFRIVQEALTNVTRHADAHEVFITLEQTGDDCWLEVRDDGRGFDPVAIPRKSFGLAGMKERVLMLGGALDVASSPGHGTSIKVRVPFGSGV
jgi:PAS domain S-box-containing protein